MAKKKVNPKIEDLSEEQLDAIASESAFNEIEPFDFFPDVESEMDGKYEDYNYDDQI